MVIQTADDPKYNIDLHVHTSFGSACAELHDPETIPGAMANRNLHGIVITEHNTLWQPEAIKYLNSRLPGHRIYNGIEVSSASHHFILIGVDTMEGIFPGIHPEKLITLVKQCGAVLILVHPQLITTDLSRIPFAQDVDAVEVASTITSGYFENNAVELCRRHSLNAVAGSDAHCSEKLGDTFTSFPALPEDEKELAWMIRKGVGVPMRRDNSGRGVAIC